MKRFLFLAATHSVALAAGFAAGIYALPILTAPDAPSDEEVAAMQKEAVLVGHFRRDLEGSDFLHWGEGTVHVSHTAISFMGEIAPGPDYKLYLSPVFVEKEADFLQHKPQMVRVGDVKTFDNFIVPLPEGIDPAGFGTVIVWCESFGEFITAARYGPGAE